MTQVAVQPPKFLLFINYPKLMTEAYKKYLYNQFREHFGFSGVPLILQLKGKQSTREEALEAKKDGAKKEKQAAPAKETPKNREDELSDEEFFDDENFEVEGWDS